MPRSLKKTRKRSGTGGLERRAAAFEIRYARGMLESTTRQVLSTPALSHFKMVDGKVRRIPNEKGQSYIDGAKAALAKARVDFRELSRELSRDSERGYVPEAS